MLFPVPAFSGLEMGTGMGNKEHNVVYPMMQVKQSWWEARKPNHRFCHCFYGYWCPGSQITNIASELLEVTLFVGSRFLYYLPLCLSFSLQPAEKCTLHLLQQEVAFREWASNMSLFYGVRKNSSTALNFGTLAGSKINRPRRKHDKHH